MSKDAKILAKAQSLRNNLRKRKQQKDNRRLNIQGVSAVEKIKIVGCNPLKGIFKVPGSKNAALPLVVASLLSDEKIIIDNIPNLSDMDTIFDILRELNVDVDYKNGKVVLDAKCVDKCITSYDLASKMRASILVIGVLLAKHKRAEVPLPGGCSIGVRPVDIHINALIKMGAKIEVEHGYIKAEAPNGLVGCDITFDKISVGATENIMMAATLAKGTTRLINAACEPEIMDLANLLNKMGAKVEGAGSSLIVIEGVESLNGAIHSVIPDRIQAGSYAIAAVATKGEIILEGINIDIFGDFIIKLQETGTKVVDLGEDTIEISYGGCIKAVDVNTTPHPGFATDLQAPWMVLMAIAEGKSFIRENIFENRFNHVPELLRMGADIVVQDHNTAIINGVASLSAAEVRATDLRASFALIIAGLVAEGETVVTKLHHLDRGYVNTVEILTSLGANIKRGVDI